MTLNDPFNPIDQQAFLDHHQVEVEWDDHPRLKLGWGFYWKHGFMSGASMKEDKAEAVAVTALFCHWWLLGITGFDPGQLLLAAWLFHNGPRIAEIKARGADDADHVRVCEFAEQQLLQLSR